MILKFCASIDRLVSRGMYLFCKKCTPKNFNKKIIFKVTNNSDLDDDLKVEQNQAIIDKMSYMIEKIIL